MKKRTHLINGMVDMMDVSKIFDLLSKGNNNSEISRKLGIARSTIRDYCVKANSKNLDYKELSKLSSQELVEKFELKHKGRKRKKDLNINLEELSKELLKKGVTKLLLYEEYYSKSQQESLSYGAFCERIRSYQKETKLCMKQVYKGGDKYFVDFSGVTIPIFNKAQKEPCFYAQVFVATMGASNYTYVEAVSSQKVEDFISATVRSLNFLGGVAQCLVPDNLKAAVTKNYGYQFDINKTYQELANYYQLSVLPARVRKPQDKAKVETAVKLIQQQIIAPIRNERFYSLAELNKRILILLEKFNDRVMKSYGCSRKELFNSVDKPELKPLPISPFELCVWKQAKVHPDYHIGVDNCYYSVPHQYRGARVDVAIKERVIEIYKDSVQIAVHKRLKSYDLENPKSQLSHRFSTIPEHLPSSHAFYKDWTMQMAISVASSIGIETTNFVNNVFGNYKYEPQAIRATMGMPNLLKKYGKELIEIVAREANQKKIYSVKYLKQRLEQLSFQKQKPVNEIIPIDDHCNVRGNGYYH